MESHDLQQMEKKVYLTYHGDGIWDLFLGLWFLLTGLFFYLDLAYMMAIMVAVMFPVIVGIKKAFTFPRLGYVSFSQARKDKERTNKKIMTLVFSFTVLAGLVVFYAFTGNADWQRALKSLGIIPFGAVLALVFGTFGWLYGISRFIIYAGLALAVFVGSRLLKAYPAIPFLILGVIIGIVGIVLLISFMRKYPKDTGETAHAG